MLRHFEPREAWDWIRARRGSAGSDPPGIAERVFAIVQQVRAGGDGALLALTRELDGADLDAARLRVGSAEIEAARARVAPAIDQAIRYAHERIVAYHRHQRLASFLEHDPTGVLLGYRVSPLRSVGVYVPGGAGGSTPLISSALMGIVPAVCAGVDRIVAVSPPRPDGSLDDRLLMAMDLAGAHEIYRIGGAQAVAALAWGTFTMAPVDKIVGPGNAWVSAAKKQVHGRVDIDKIAGPSEVAILAGDGARADYIAADMLAQAEHDPQATAVLVTPSADLLDRVAAELARQAPDLPRHAIIERALADHGALLRCADLEDGIAMVEAIAPEHLEILTGDPRAVSDRIRNAGAIFLGPESPQAIGDYVAGPNHTLPTGGTARFASPLGVWDFVKRTSVIGYTRDALRPALGPARTLASLEGLLAHERSLAIRDE